MQTYRRKKKLIDPALQWKFIVIFTCIACVAILFQGMVVNRLLVKLSDELPNDGALLDAELPSVLFSGLGLALLLLVPLAVSLGILTTFRIAGPLYRFRAHLGEIARGQDPGPCRIRSDDELQDLCELINQAVGVLKGELEPLPALPEAAAEDGEDAPNLRLVS